MRISRAFWVCAIGVSILACGPANTPLRASDDHVVKPSDLQNAIVESSGTRQEQTAKVREFFSSEPAQRALQSAHIDPEKINRAVSLLDDQELSRLALRTERIQKDIAAGALNNQQITYILIALATAVIILVIVEAR